VAVLISSRGRAVTLLLAIATALLVPRAVALRGLPYTSALDFKDLHLHALNLRLVEREALLQRLVRERKAPPMVPGFSITYNTVKWPPGVYYVAQPMARIFGPLSTWTVQLTNLVFTLVLLAGVAGLGRRLGSWRIGLWGALLTALCPPLVAATWYLSLDYPLLALTTVALLLLHLTRGFRDLRWTLAFAAWSVLGLWIKVTYAAYLVLPCLVALASGLRAGRPRWRPPLQALVGAAGCALGAALLLDFDYLNTARVLLNHMTLATADVPGLDRVEMIPGWTLRGIAAPLLHVAGNFPWPLLMLALPGLIALHAGLASKDRPGSPAPLLLAALWGAYLFQVLMVHRQERYLQPIYPLLCLLTAWIGYRLPPQRWRGAVLAWTVTAFCAVLVLTHISPPPWLPGRGGYAWANQVPLRMPSRVELESLRELGFDPTCDLLPAQRAMRALAGDPRAADQPLLVGASWDGYPSGELLGAVAAQVLPRRPIWPHEFADDLPPGLLSGLHPPDTLLFHPRGTGRALITPPARVVARREFDLVCGDQRTRLVASLVRGAYSLGIHRAPARLRSLEFHPSPAGAGRSSGSGRAR
jgi:hypothetical protein